MLLGAAIVAHALENRGCIAIRATIRLVAPRLSSGRFVGKEEVVDEQYRVYVGIDWATEVHQACVLDAERQVLGERSFAHTGDAIAAFAAWLDFEDDEDCTGLSLPRLCHFDRLGRPAVRACLSRRS